MHQNLVKAIVDLALFLEFSSDKIVDADAATEAMEQLASTLLAMNSDDQTEFANISRELALEFENVREREFVIDLPTALGLGAVD